MAFFSGGDGRVKLLLLYMIKRFRTPVTREQLYTAMVNADSTGFFEMSEMLASLEEEKYVLTVPVRQRQLIFLTEKGAELADTFEREIARSVRDEAAGYIDEHREEVRRENCIVTDALPNADGSWRLTMSILEGGGAAFEISLHMPDAASTFRAQQRWLAEADRIYLETLERLCAPAAESGEGLPAPEKEPEE
jgi:hypothetical protein